MGYLHEVQIFMNFTNGPASCENLCWAMLACGIQAMRSNDRFLDKECTIDFTIAYTPGKHLCIPDTLYI